MLTIARTPMTKPDRLLLDEPSERLAPLIVALLADMIIRIHKEGVLENEEIKEKYFAVS